MDAKIRREALKAAAKVALSLAAVSTFACGAKTEEQKTEESASMAGTSPAPNGTGNAGTTPNPSPSPTPTPTGTSTSNPPTPTVDAAVADAALDLAQCEAKLDAIEASRATDAETDWMGQAFPNEPGTVACCDALLRAMDADWQNETKHRWSCCKTINGEENPFGGPGLACTPWGPPMPPSMPMVA